MKLHCISGNRDSPHSQNLIASIPRAWLIDEYKASISFLRSDPETPDNDWIEEPRPYYQRHQSTPGLDPMRTRSYGRGGGRGEVDGGVEQPFQQWRPGRGSRSRRR